MPVYSFESPRSLPRLAHSAVATDTSYMIALCIEKDPAILQFHAKAINLKVDFFINSVVRQEFLKYLRKSAIINGITELVKDPSFVTRYETVLNLNPGRFRHHDIKYNFEKIYKDHVKRNDVGLLLNPSFDIGAQAAGFLSYGQLNYYETNDKEVSYDDLSNLINLYGMAPSDGLIAVFAFAIGARAIITLDTDFVHLSNAVDIYMPLDTAAKCALYQSNAD